MLGLIHLVSKRGGEPQPRLWLVFFGEGEGASWWTKVFRPGFRHICAAAWYPDQQRWVYVNPTWRGTAIELYGETEFDARLGQLATSSQAILRFGSRFDRSGTPAAWHCVGAIKALLGVKSRALSPFSLFRHLQALGAEIVEVPNRVRPIPIAEAASGGPGDQALARAGAGTRQAGQDQINPGSASTGNLAA